PTKAGIAAQNRSGPKPEKAVVERVPPDWPGEQLRCRSTCGSGLARTRLDLLAEFLELRLIGFEPDRLIDLSFRVSHISTAKIGSGQEVMRLRIARILPQCPAEKVRGISPLIF